MTRDGCSGEPNFGDTARAELQPVYGDASDHVSEARHRARQVLSGEAHLGPIDDWRRALISARDAVIWIWLLWIGLHGLADPPYTGSLLIAVGAGLSLLIGISTARSVQAQVDYFASELERERSEIRDNIEHEIEEVRALYAAKGFQEPLLTEVVNVLTADDDRLLKVMMEEELGLSMYHVNHPLIVGIWNSGAALLASMGLSIPVALARPDFAHYWMPGAAGALLLILSVLSGRATRRSWIVMFTASVVMAVVCGGVVYFLAQWLGRNVQLP